MQNETKKPNMKFNEILPNQQDSKNLGSRNCLIDSSYHSAGFGKKFNRYDIKTEKELLRKNYSLKSFKSHTCEEDDFSQHFNSFPVISPSEKTKIKIIHKPYTHLDNHRIQKCFKIYNEFVNIVLKNRDIFIQN